MAGLFNRLFGKRKDNLQMASEEQALRLKLDEVESKFRKFRDMVASKEAGEDSRVTDVIRAKLEPLFADAAAPASQIVTQQYLMETGGKQVDAAAVMAVAVRLVHSLEDAGMRIEGNPGDTVKFDPNLHESLSREVSISPGQPVVVRFAGVSYDGKILRRAGVERAEQ